MTSDVRIVGADVVAEPGVVMRDAEIALSPLTGLISYLGPAAARWAPVTSTAAAGSPRRD